MRTTGAAKAGRGGQANGRGTEKTGIPIESSPTEIAIGGGRIGIEAEVAEEIARLSRTARQGAEAVQGEVAAAALHEIRNLSNPVQKKLGLLPH
eukprot:jgi/Ulvmu1/3212/UM015_0253.1